MNSARWVNALCVALGLTLFAWWGYPLRERAFSGENDFMQLYCGARLVRTPDLYNFEACKEIQKQITREHTYYPSVYYSRPPFYALLLSPLARLPYHTAYWIWQSFSLAMAGGFLYAYGRRYPEIIVLASLSVPLLVNLANAQDVAIAMALAGFSILLAGRGRDFAAGLLLSLAAIKFHLFVLVPLLLLIHRRWRFLAGGAAGGAALLILSFLGGGWYWIRDYLGTLSSPEIHLSPDRMPTLRNWVFFFTGAENLPLELALSAAVAALFAFLVWRIPDLRVGAGLAMPAGLLVCHHAYSQDLLLLLLSIALFAAAGASRLLWGVTVLASLPPTAFLLFWAFPFSVAVPLLLIAILAAGLHEARRHRSPAASLS